MHDISSGRPIIFIDQKWFRIRIHRNTLHMLGNPAFVQLLVNPESRVIAIRPTSVRDSKSHRVQWKRMGSRQSYELHSCHFIRNLQRICTDWECGESYRLFGEILHSENIALFELKKAVPMSDQEINDE